jgi:hypothetical protein
LIPLRIGEVLFQRRCEDREEVIIEAHMREQDDSGITWNAQAADRNGEVLMTVKNLKMVWFTENGL